MKNDKNGKIMFCKHCGAKLPAESNFCDKCGMKVTSSSDEAMTNEAKNRRTSQLNSDEEMNTRIDNRTNMKKYPNKKNKLKIVMIMIVFVVAIAGISGIVLGTQHSKEKNTAESHESSSVDGSSTTISSSSIQSSSNTNASVPSSSISNLADSWDAEKKDQLADFMNDWGKTMNQRYMGFTPSASAQYWGVNIPRDLVDGNSEWQATIGNRPLHFEWADFGDKTSGADSVVAVYSDMNELHHTGSQVESGEHLYFFAFIDNEPKVLMADSITDNYIEFIETKNVQLSEGFANIIKSEASSEVASSEDSDSVKQLIDFVDGYQVPVSGHFTVSDSEICYHTDSAIPDDKTAKSNMIIVLQEMSEDAKNQIGLNIRLELSEPQESGNSITFVDGQVTQANQVFGRIVKGIE